MSRGVWLVLPLGLRIVHHVQAAHAGHFSSEKEESEHIVLNLLLEVVEQGSSGTQVKSFFADEELGEDSTELSSFCGSPVPGDVKCLVV